MISGQEGEQTKTHKDELGLNVVSLKPASVLVAPTHCDKGVQEWPGPSSWSKHTLGLGAQRLREPATSGRGSNGRPSCCLRPRR